jgi:hypothetical protein
MPTYNNKALEAVIKMPYRCHICKEKVFRNTDRLSIITGEPLVCDARKEDHPVHVCNPDAKKEFIEDAKRRRFLVSVRPETANALLG